jgi:antitoxin component YwqK of YwqJK toxin-antitoxin module
MKEKSVKQTGMSKYLFYSIFIVAALITVTGCKGRTNAAKELSVAEDSVSRPDTGYTGIKQFMSGKYIVSEVTFQNGIRQGLTKTFYKSGRLQRTYWYKDGLRQDSSCWYYEEGQVFRVTPFVNDTVNGIQKQFYRTGQIKAKMGYSKGLRTPFFQEFTREGKLVTGYPEIVVKAQDNYKTTGQYDIAISLSKKADVRFFRGEFTNGLYDTTRLKKIKTYENTGYLNLKKTGTAGKSYVGVIGEVLTDFGNRILIYKKIDLPYNDLN